jgi:hypothetical protein
MTIAALLLLFVAAVSGTKRPRSDDDSEPSRSVLRLRSLLDTSAIVSVNIVTAIFQPQLISDNVQDESSLWRTGRPDLDLELSLGTPRPQTATPELTTAPLHRDPSSSSSPASNTRLFLRRTGPAMPNAVLGRNAGPSVALQQLRSVMRERFPPL